jgi:hypothetical protein
MVTFLYKPFEHHHEVKAVVVASNVFTFHLPPVRGGPPVPSVIVVAKAAHVILMFLAAVATTNVYPGVPTLASISVGDEQQVP